MKSLDSSSFAELLAAPGLDAGTRSVVRGQVLRAAAPLAIVVALGGLWAAAAPLSGAIVAPAQIKVELNRKTVQHQEGGIVREILVRDGQQVRAGDPLLVVGDVRPNAELSLLQGLIHAERIRQARAAAEAALEPRFAVSGDLAQAASEPLARERALFAARRRTLDEQIASLHAQIREAQAQATALASQIAATETSTRLADEELEINAKLAEQGYVQRTRVLALQRGAADYRGKVGEYRSELALARSRAAELDARIAQARNQYQSQAADELKDATVRLRELEERLRPSADQVERQFVRAPVDGEVMALRVAAPGEAVGPRQPLLEVVPAREKLVIEARIRPEDIDYVRRDSPAEVRLTAFDMRDAPLLPGKVVFVSPDRVTRAETGESWFTAVAEVDAAALGNQPNVRLQAGMPAELYVTTPARTVVEYLAKPLRGFASRGMREP
jgi:HlyD family type I secretion membrane fusion protein